MYGKASGVEASLFRFLVDRDGLTEEEFCLVRRYGDKAKTEAMSRLRNESGWAQREIGQRLAQCLQAPWPRNFTKAKQMLNNEALTQDPLGGATYYW